MSFEDRNPYAQIRVLWRVIGLLTGVVVLGALWVVRVEWRHNRDVRELILERCD